MAFDINKNTRNRDAETEGTWFVYDEDVQFLVARKNNPKYRSAISKGYRENERVISSNTNTDRAEKVSEQLMLEALANYVLLDWKGMVENGKPIEYTPGRAMSVLEEHDDLRKEIEEYADNRENYLAEKDKKDAKNLKKS